MGTVTWGHVTGVLEDNTRTFADNWTGTGEIQNSGDAERLALNSGEYMNSEVVNTGTFTIQLLQNNYQAADTVLLRYRTAADIPTLDGAAWINYTGEFDSLGYVQIRVEATV